MVRTSGTKVIKDTAVRGGGSERLLALGVVCSVQRVCYRASAHAAACPQAPKASVLLTSENTTTGAVQNKNTVPTCARRQIAGGPPTARTQPPVLPALGGTRERYPRRPPLSATRLQQTGGWAERAAELGRRGAASVLLRDGQQDRNAPHR
ncbi:hypothetical protein NDU88_000383 [Pleurodeles waltl]|uniref:Uncharacterized protein n=1 Tax=Pleurodeles waltl TaxID=8319 RepID=A0AAV7U3B4_PLEWA|nr:hypothetical protein NDU88_000383 [Pleurodeles waltl]